MDNLRVRAGLATISSRKDQMILIFGGNPGGAADVPEGAAPEAVAGWLDDGGSSVVEQLNPQLWLTTSGSGGGGASPAGETGPQRSPFLENSSVSCKVD